MNIAWRAGAAVATGLLMVLLPSLGGAPLHAEEDTLRQSQQHQRDFPFGPNCSGNTQEMVACLWQRRNQADAALARRLGGPELLERWRATRRQVCAKAAEKARGGSVHPLVGLSCENSLNKALLLQLGRPLLQSVDVQAE